MKKLIITLALLCSTVAMALSQTYTIRPEKSDLRFGVGTSLSDQMSSTLEYGYRIDPQVEVGIFGAYTGSSYNYYDGYAYIESGLNYWTFGLFLRYSWITTETFSLYSSGSLAWTIDDGSDPNNIYYDESYGGSNLPNLGIVLAGITVGNKLFGFAEVGVSFHSTVKLGVGCRF